jgi:hypothetical protein
MSDSTLHPAHPDAHPDVELLAEHAERLLAPEQSAELAAHLDSCPECGETYAALAELTSLLGEEPAPGPMPDDVVARIDAALAAERERADAPAETHRAAAASPTAEGDGDESADADEGGEADESGDAAGRVRSTRRPAGERPGDNRPGNRSRRSARMRRLMATLAVFVAAGGIGIAVSRGGDIDGSASAGANAGRGPAAAAAPSPKVQAAPVYDFSQANLASEVQRLASDSARHASGHAAGTVPTGSAPAGASPSATTTPSGVGALVTPHTGAENSPAAPGQPSAPPCVLAATGQTQPPSVQGLGHYLGVEVFALLYPDAADPAHTWNVYLVQSSCSAPLVLLHQSVPRT